MLVLFRLDWNSDIVSQKLISHILYVCIETKIISAVIVDPISICFICARRSYFALELNREVDRLAIRNCADVT